MSIVKWGVVKRGTVLGLLLWGGIAHAEAVDPTQPIDVMPPPPGTAVVGETGMSVNMIVIRGGQGMALMSGRYVRVNDTVAGAKVMAIGRNFVELQQGGGSIRHYLAGFGTQAEKIK